MKRHLRLILVFSLLCLMTSCFQLKETVTDYHSNKSVTLLQSRHNGLHSGCAVCMQFKNNQNLVNVHTIENETITESNATVLEDKRSLIEGNINAKKEYGSINLPENVLVNGTALKKHKIAEALSVKLIEDKRTMLKNAIDSTVVSSKPGNTNTGRMNGFAVSGFVCGIIGILLLFLTGFPFFLGLLATIFSAIGINQTANGERGRGLAIAGLILGILTVMLFWLLVVLLASIIFL